MTTRASGLKANLAGGRPPVEAASPDGVSSPAASRASTRAATVERARPVSLAQLSAGAGCAVAHELEQLAGSGRPLGAANEPTVLVTCGSEAHEVLVVSRAHKIVRLITDFCLTCQTKVALTSGRMAGNGAAALLAWRDIVKQFPGVGARRRRPRRPPRRGALPPRPERRRQVDPDQGARRRRTSPTRARSPGSGEEVHLAHPQAAMRPRHRHDLPGARPRRRPHRRREHLPRPRAESRSGSPSAGPPRSRAAAAPASASATPRSRRAARSARSSPPASRSSAWPARSRTTPADRHGRAVGGARRRRGRATSSASSATSPPRASPSSTSRTGSRRSARSATASPCSRTAGPSPPACRPRRRRPRSSSG